MSPLQIQWDRIRRRWVLILVIGLVAGAGALGASLLQGSTYTGRAALTIVSQDRAPEQDTVLAQGYADYFNQPSSQEVLRQAAGVSSSVALNARIAAASPIVYIEATTTNADVAADASSKMAVALRNDVNQGLSGDSERQIEDLQRQLAAAQASKTTARSASSRTRSAPCRPTPTSSRTSSSTPGSRRTPPTPRATAARRWSAVCCSACCWRWRWGGSRTAS